MPQRLCLTSPPPWPPQDCHGQLWGVPSSWGALRYRARQWGGLVSGGSPYPELQRLAVPMLNAQIKHAFSLALVWVPKPERPRDLNVRAGYLSRAGEGQQHHYTVRADRFAGLDGLWGPHRFAADDSRQPLAAPHTGRFCAQPFHPEAEWTDPLAISWAGENSSVFPHRTWSATRRGSVLARPAEIARGHSQAKQRACAVAALGRLAQAPPSSGDETVAGVRSAAPASAALAAARIEAGPNLGLRHPRCGRSPPPLRRIRPPSPRRLRRAAGPGRRAGAGACAALISATLAAPPCAGTASRKPSSGM